MKKAGCCTLCDAEVYEAVTRHTSGPYEGNIRDVGPALENMRKLTFVLTDGTTCQMTFCAECEPTPENMPLIWKRVLEATMYEETNKFKIGIRFRSPEHQDRIDAFHRKLVTTVPLGVLYGDS